MPSQRHSNTMVKIGIFLTHSWNHTVQQTGGDKHFSVNISRALNRLKAAYVTLYKEPLANTRYREANYFYHPMVNQ
eukprot:11545912-Heterocapsa_arctica.AAC.1